MTDTVQAVPARRAGTDAFVSYSRVDRPAVRRLAAALQERDRTLWVDWEGIPPTAEWMVEIREAIDAADAVIFVLSPTSLGSRVCSDELAHAEAAHKRIVPLVVQDVDAAQVPPALAKRNWLFLRDGDDVNLVADQVVEVLDVDLDAVKRHTRLTVRAAEWEAAGRDRAGLLRGSDLTEAERWLASPGRGPSPTPGQTTFMVASRQAASRRQRGLVVAVSAALVVALALGGFALVQRSTAVSQRDLARTQALASASLAALDRDPETSLLLALEATKSGRTPLVEEALRKSVLASHVERTFVPGKAKESLGDLTFSLDGRRVYASNNKSRRVVGYDLASGREVVSASLPQTRFPWIQGLAAVGQGQVVVATDMVRRLDLGTGRTTDIPEAAAPALPYYSVAPSADGASIFTAGLDGVAREIRVSDGTLVRTYTGARGEIYDAEPSPDGTTLAVSGQDGLVRLYDRRTARVKATIKVGSPGSVAKWSTSGKLLLTTSQDRIARIWDVRTREVVQQMGHAALLNDATWVPGDDYIVTVDSVGVARIWAVGSGDVLTELRGHTAWISYVAASPDGRRIATSSEDGSVRVWRLGPSIPVARHTTAETVNGFDISRDARLLVSASYAEGTVLSDARTGRTVRTLDAQAVAAPAFSPDAKTVATLLYDGPRPAVRLREVSSRRVLWEVADLGTLPGLSRLEDPAATPDRPAAPLSASFSPDGSRLAVLTELGVRILDARDGRLVGEYAGVPRNKASNRTALRQVADLPTLGWSPDGTFLAIPDGRAVVVIDPGDATERRRLPVARDRVNAVAVSADGRRIVAVSQDQSLRILTLRDGREVLRLDLQARGIGVAVSRRGFIASVAQDGYLRVWNRSGVQVMRTRVATAVATSVRFTTDGRRLVVGTGEGFDERVGLLSGGGLNPSGAAQVVSCEVCRSYHSLVAFARSRVTRSLSERALGEALGEELRGSKTLAARSPTTTTTARGHIDRRLTGRWRTDLAGPRVPDDLRSEVGPVLLRFYPDGTFWVWQDHSGPDEGTARTHGAEIVVRTEMCGAAEGRYRWSATGDEVRLTPTTDDCAYRRAELSSNPLRRVQ